MHILERLKTESIRLRKEKSPLASFSVFMISEIEKVGKNAGNRATTEDEAIQYLKKQITTTEYNIGLPLNEDRAETMQMELEFLKSYLPQMADENEVRDLIKLWKAGGQNKGQIMKGLKVQYGALVDMKRAGEIIDEA